MQLSLISQEHKKSTSPVKGPTSPVRKNISPVREQRKSPVREDPTTVRVASKTGKKRQSESHASEKRGKVMPSEESFNQYASKTDGYDSELETESQSVQSFNFDKVKKIDNQCKMPPTPPPTRPPLPLHEKIVDVICSNFVSRVSETTSMEIEKKILHASNCPLSIRLANTELWRIVSSNQRKGDVKSVTRSHYKSH